MLRNKRGQSTLEYIVVFTAIVAGILVFAWTQLRPAVSNVMNSASTRITNAATTFNPAQNLPNNNT